MSLTVSPMAAYTTPLFLHLLHGGYGTPNASKIRAGNGRIGGDYMQMIGTEFKRSREHSRERSRERSF